MLTEVCKLSVTLLSIVCITVIELYALHLGYDGVLLAGVIAVIAGIAGYNVKPLLQFFKARTPTK